MRGPRTAMKSGPRSPQLEKALAQKRRPSTAINKLKKKKKKTSVVYSGPFFLHFPPHFVLCSALDGKENFGVCEI